MTPIGAMQEIQDSITIPAFLRVHASSELVPQLLMPLLGARAWSSCLASSKGCAEPGFFPPGLIGFDSSKGEPGCTYLLSNYNQ